LLGGRNPPGGQGFRQNRGLSEDGGLAVKSRPHAFPQHLSRGARRARPVRPLWRAVRRRNADAADPRGPARLTARWGGAKIYLKREDLNHTGAHKINNTMGQILLAKRMGKRRIIAETGAGQHGVATATVCALFDIPCVVYMGAVDIERQQPNVFRMKLLGAEVRSVTSGTATL